MVLPPPFWVCYGDRPAKKETWKTTPAAGRDKGLARQTGDNFFLVKTNKQIWSNRNPSLKIYYACKNITDKQSNHVLLGAILH